MRSRYARGQRVVYERQHMISDDAADMYLDALREAVRQAGFDYLDLDLFAVSGPEDITGDAPRQKNPSQRLLVYLDGLKSYFDIFTRERMLAGRMALFESTGQFVDSFSVIFDDEVQARYRVKERKVRLDAITNTNAVDILLHVISVLQDRVKNGGDEYDPPPDIIGTRSSSRSDNTNEG